MAHTHKVGISFDIVVPIQYKEPFDATETYAELEQKSNEIMMKLKEDIENNKLDLNVDGLNLEVDPSSFTTEYTQLQCDVGRIPRYSTFNCGKFFNIYSFYVSSCM